MKVLIDTNVAITYITGREDAFSAEIEEIMRSCAEERMEGILAFHSLSTIWYVTRKLPDDLRRRWILQLCTLLSIAGAEQRFILQVVRNTAFKDFEDALQDCCAAAAGAEFIITANVKDYRGHSLTPAVTPAEFLRIMKRGHD